MDSSVLMVLSGKLNADLWEKLNGIAQAIRGEADSFFGMPAPFFARMKTGFVDRYQVGFK